MMAVATEKTQAVLEMTFSLAELPTSQHRAGLAGLVLMLEWLDRQPDRAHGLCRLLACDERGATVQVDCKGMQRLFDSLYGASQEERRVDKPYKKGKELVAPLRIDTEQVANPKTGKVVEKNWYVYPVVVPTGAAQVDWAPSNDDPGKGWLKLWRDFVWSILRGVPTQRGPYNDRSTGAPCGDADKEWTALNTVRPRPAELASTYLVGTMAATAENVPFKDVARFRFLLHFWPIVAQIHVPRTIDREGKADALGYALAIPDVARLRDFCDVLPATLKNRDASAFGFRPREAFVDLAEESALDCQRRLHVQLQTRLGAGATADVVFGFDVFHMAKEGNNVRILWSGRCEPTLQMVDDYGRLRSAYWSPLFRRQRLRNLFAGQRWYEGFADLLRTVDWRVVMPGGDASEAAKQFHHDTRQAFEHTEENMAEVRDSRTAEQLVYRAVGSYLSQKLKSKHDLTWQAASGDQAGEQKFSEARQKLAREVFLAVRSRTGADFIDYFAATLYSVPHHMSEDVYADFARALYADPDRIRTLTLLALSARA